MAGLFDLFGGSGDSGGNSLYDGLLTAPQQQGLQQRGLLGGLAALAKSGALDYTAPFLSGKVPGGFAQALASFGGGIGQGQDQGLMNTLNARLTALKGTQLANQIALQRSGLDQNAKIMQQLLGGGAGVGPAAAAGPAGVGPQGVLPAGSPSNSSADDSGSGADGAAPPEAGAMMQYLIDKHGFSPAAAAGALGNAAIESSFRTDLIGDHGTSGGLFQNHNNRLDNLKSFAESQGKPWTDPTVQLDFMAQEAKSMLPTEFFQSKDPLHAAQQFQDVFERPAQDSGRARGAAAASILSSFGLPQRTAQMPQASPDAGDNASGLPPLSSNYVFGTPTAPSNAGSIMPSAVPNYGTPPSGQAAGPIPPGYRPPSPIAGAQFGGPQLNGTGAPIPPSVIPAAAQQSPQQQSLLPQPAASPMPALLQPQAAPAQPSLMPGGALSNLDRQMIGLGLINANKGLTGQDYTSLIGAIQNSPGYQGQIAGTKKNAENQSDLNYKPQIAGRTKAAEAPYVWNALRPGQVGGYGGNMTAFNPPLVETYNPQTGMYERGYAPAPPGISNSTSSGMPMAAGNAPTAMAQSPNPLIAKPGPGVAADLETSAKGLAEAEQKSRQANIDAGSSAQAQNVTLQRMRDDAPKFYQGPGANQIADLKSIARALPGGDKLADSVAGYEDFIKNAGALTRQAVRDTSPRAAVQEFNLIGAALPQPTTSPKGFDQVSSEYMGLNDYRIAKTQAQKIWEQRPDSRGEGDVRGFETDWQARVSPYAFVVMRLAPDDQQKLFSQVAQTKAGQAELQHLAVQMRYIRDSGLDKFR